MLEGIDFLHTGIPQKINIDAIQKQLKHDAIVVISPLGYTKTGEILNLSLDDLAAKVAVDLQADKFILFTETNIQDPLERTVFSPSSINKTSASATTV